MPPKSALLCFRTFSPEVLSAFTAFVNTYGGTIFIGNSQSPIDDIRTLQQEFSELLRDISPNIESLYKTEIIPLQSGFQFIVHILPGNQTPYLFQNKAYIFREGLCFAANERDLQQLIQKNIDKIPFELRCSDFQNLTFNAFSKAFMGFSEECFEKFHFKTKIGFFNNLALICSDQNPFNIIFSDETKPNRLEREFSGSVFQQLNSLKELLKPYSYTPKKLLSGKQDAIGYPEIALKSFLVQAIIQRDYRVNIPSVIRVKPDRIEFTVYNENEGRIDPRIIFTDLELRRNKLLTDLFIYCGELQRFGDDLKSTLESYGKQLNKPQIIDVPSGLKLTLPKTAHLRPGCPLERVLNVIKNKPNIEKSDIDSIITNHSPAYNALLLRTLANEGLIFRNNTSFCKNDFCF